MFLLTGVLALSNSGHSSPATLAADFFPGVSAGNGVNTFPGNFHQTSETVLFVSGDIGRGIELWRTDGTSVGTALVADINMGGASSNPHSFANSPNGVLFRATDGFYDGIWHCNWAGTTVERLAFDHLQLSNIGPLKTVGNKVYFTALTSDYGNEVWATDGTAKGTHVLSDIYPGPKDGSPANLTSFKENLYFTTTHTSGTRSVNSLWRSDGTEVGTTALRIIDPGPIASTINKLTDGRTCLYFIAPAVGSGNELWKTDGSDVGTTLVADIKPGTESSNPQYLTVVRDKLFFMANDGSHSRELWKSDGTSSGTRLVKNLRKGQTSSNLLSQELVAAGEKLFFTWQDLTGNELYVSDGTPTGTYMVKDIYPGWLGGIRSGDSLCYIAGTVYFPADEGKLGTELWRTDGTDRNTTIVKDIWPGLGRSYPKNLTACGNLLFFCANDWTHGPEPWLSDGTAEGTTMIADTAASADSSTPSNIVSWADNIWLSAYRSNLRSPLWRIQTSDNFTTNVTYLSNVTPYIAQFLAFGEDLLLHADYALYSLKAGTLEPIRLKYFSGQYPGGGIYFFRPSRMILAEHSAVFAVYAPGYGDELWTTDGTETGTKMLTDIRPGTYGSSPTNFASVGKTVYFTASQDGGSELWKTDGSALGTSKVPLNAKVPRDLSVFRNELYFTATTNLSVNGTLWPARGLWKVTSSTQETARVLDVIGQHVPQMPSDTVSNFVNCGEYMVYLNNLDATGEELWRTDGTTIGTYMLRDINPGKSSSGVKGITNVGKSCVFSATDGILGEELWITDGTVDGTRLLCDIWPGLRSSNPGELYPIGDDNRFIFAAADGVHGIELWYCNIAENQVQLLQDINEMWLDSNPSAFCRIADYIYFSARTGSGRGDGNGQELWKLPVAALPNESTVHTWEEYFAPAKRLP